MAAKKCTKKGDAGTKLLFGSVFNLLLFVTFSLPPPSPSPSSDLKVPYDNLYGEGKEFKY